MPDDLGGILASGWRRYDRRHAGLAQLAEQPPCKRQVIGSTPIPGSRRPHHGLKTAGVSADAGSVAKKRRGLFGWRTCAWCGKSVDPAKPRVTNPRQTLVIGACCWRPLHHRLDVGLAIDRKVSRSDRDRLLERLAGLPDDVVAPPDPAGGDAVEERDSE